MVAEYTRVGLLRRGTLEVVVANSTLVQELGFQKHMLLRKLAALLPDEGIENLRSAWGISNSHVNVGQSTSSPANAAEIADHDPFSVSCRAISLLEIAI